MNNLTDEQQIAFDYVLTQKYGVMFVTGYAGTGKTYWACKLIENYLNNPSSHILVLCPTHQAKIQFTSRLNMNERLRIQTIASFLKQYPSEMITGEYWWQKGGYEGTSTPYNLIIIDECSMGSDYDITELIKASKSDTPCMVIFMGDILQLRPVMKKNADYLFANMKTFCFKKQQRNFGPILSLVTKLRTEVVYPEQTIIDTNAEIIVHTEKNDFIDDYLYHLLDTDKPYDVVYLAYTNEAVNQVKIKSHEILYGDKPFNKNQYIKLADTCSAGYNGSLCKILSIFSIENEKILNIDVVKYKLQVYCFDTKQTGEIFVVSPIDQSILEKNLVELYGLSGKAYKKDMDLYDHYQFLISRIRKITFLKSPFAQTIHGAQGMTIPEVYVDTQNIKLKGKDRRRLLYVGCSRAQRRLHTIKIL